MKNKEIKSKRALNPRELGKVIGGVTLQSASYVMVTNASPDNLDGGKHFFVKSLDPSGNRQLSVYNDIHTKIVNWNWTDGKPKKAAVENYLGTGNSVLFKQAYEMSYGTGSWPGWG